MGGRVKAGDRTACTTIYRRENTTMSQSAIQMMDEFQHIREALEEHLSSINENTTEIQALFDYLQEMEIRVEKMCQRLDNLQLCFGQPLQKPTVEPLDQLEKKVFLVMYTETMPLSYEEISANARVPSGLVPECISSLIDKGVPLLRSLVNNQLFFKLSPSFKELQAKENLVNLSLHSFLE